MSFLKSFMAAAILTQAPTAFANPACEDAFLEALGAASGASFGAQVEGMAAAASSSNSSSNMNLRELAPLLGPLPSAASMGYWAQLSLQPHDKALSARDAWTNLSRLITGWARTRPNLKFDAIEEADFLYKGGEWKTKATSKKDAVLKIRVIKGEGSHARPQYWIMELDNGDDQLVGRRWLHRVVIEAEPRAPGLHLYADVSNYYAEFAGVQHVSRYKVLQVGFLNDLKAQFDTISEASSLATQAETPATLASLGVGLTHALELVQRGHDAKVVVRHVFDTIQAISRAQMSFRKFALTPAQVTQLRDFIYFHSRDLDVGQAAQFYLALWKLGYRFSTWELEAYEERLDVNAIAELTVDDIRAFSEFAGRTAKVARGLWNPTTMGRVKSELIHKFTASGEEAQVRNVRAFFHTYSDLLEVMESIHEASYEARSVSAFASMLIPRMSPKSFHSLVHVLTKQRVLLSEESERVLEQNVIQWIDEKNDEDLHLSDLMDLAKILSRPSPELIDRLSNYALQRLGDHNYYLYTRCLWSLWVMDPDKAFEFLERIDVQKATQIKDWPATVTQLTSVLGYFTTIKKRQVPWLARWLKEKKLITNVTISYSQRELFGILELLAPGVKLELEKGIALAGMSVDIFAESEKLVIEYLGPSHYWYDHLGRRRRSTSELRREELLWALGFKTFYVDFDDLNALKSLTIDDVKRVTTPGKPLEKILKELLQR